MKTVLSSLVLVLACALCACTSNQKFARNRPDVSVTAADASQSVNGFSGFLLVTDDQDWEQKWNVMAGRQSPDFHQVSQAGDGEKLIFLTFFSNPALDRNGKAHVTCAIEILRPDGSKAGQRNKNPCFEYEQNPASVILASDYTELTPEPGDMRGTWIYRMTLRDKVRGVTLPLKVAFVVK